MKIAVDYGADAVYIGGKYYSLRSRASNFEISDISNIVNYAHSKNVKVYVTMLIIDKKRMKIKDAGLPAIVLEQTPKLLRGRKLPIVKAKVGPQMMSLICDEKIFDQVPVKKEVKAQVSGIYIVSVRGLRGGNAKAPEKKKSKFKQAIDKLQEKAGAKPVK